MKIFIVTIAFVFCGALISLNLLQCVPMNNQECKVRLAMVNINRNEPLFHPYSVLVNKFSGSYYDTNNPYVKLCVPDVVKTMNIKVFNLILRTNKTRHMLWYETCA